MNSEVDALSRHLPLNPRRAVWLAPMPMLLIGCAFVVAILLRRVIPLNTDVSWLLVVGERMLDGRRLYSDIIEINPPMAAFAYLPGIALARALNVDPRHVIDGELLLLAAACLVTVSHILRLSPKLVQIKWGPFAVWAAAIMTILPMHVFGQREHIATLTFLPALAVYVLRSDRELVPLWAILVSGLGAGITLAFKPFFAVPISLCIVSSAIRSRSWLVLSSPENIIAAAFVSLVSLGTYICFPEYFTVIYPLVRDTYLSWSMSASAVLLNDATLIFAIAMVSILLTWQKPLDSPMLATALASTGFMVSFFLQRRGWAYQSYPMVALAMLAMGYALLGLDNAQSRSPRFHFAAMGALAACLVLGSQWFNADVDLGPIKESIADLKPHPRILVLSGEAAIGHPLVRDVHGVWVSRQENLWIREFVRLTREKNLVDASTDARLNDYLALERSWLIEDFKKLPPDLVLVDNLRDGWGDWARGDADMSELLKPYSFVRSISGIDILRRTD
jgi:hypothetical protein